MNKIMEGIPNQSNRPQIHSIYVEHLSDIIDIDPSSYGRSYDQRVTVDHEECCLGYDFETSREVHSVFHMDLQEQVYKSRFMDCLRKNKL